MRLSLALLVVALALAGCKRDLRGLECDPEGNCDVGFSCVGNNICVPDAGCEVASDCGPGGECVGGVCQVSSPCTCDENFNRACEIDGSCGGCLAGFVEEVPGDSASPCVDPGPVCSDDGGPCTDDGECCDGLVCNGVNECATLCTGVGNSCAGNQDCCLGTSCIVDNDGNDVCAGPDFCGDNTRTGAELCDGNDRGGVGCAELGFAGGVLGCNTDCQTYNLTGCTGGCGNELVEAGETCDPPGQVFTCGSLQLGAGDFACNDACLRDTSTCEFPFVCGNNIIDGTEACELGDLFDCQGVPGFDPNNADAVCLSNCAGSELDQCCPVGEVVIGGSCITAPPNCGDSVRVVADAEECDDGNIDNDDGCSSGCQIEPGAACAPETAPSVCFQRSPLCGDGVVQTLAGEECDPPDGACTPNCLNGPICGDGFQAAAESCDDGNTADGDGCDSACVTEACGRPGVTCSNNGECCPSLTCINSACLSL